MAALIHRDAERPRFLIRHTPTRVISRSNIIRRMPAAMKTLAKYTFIYDFSSILASLNRKPTAIEPPKNNISCNIVIATSFALTFS
jgi:hypothetical protein